MEESYLGMRGAEPGKEREKQGEKETGRRRAADFHL